MTGASASDVWPAPAKLNLFLHITGQRPDGYHYLQTVFQLLEFGDELEFTLRPDQGQTRVLDGIDSVKPEDNLCYRAAELLRADSVHLPGVDIRLTKRIPIGAGLGGGSSDAATCLHALNCLWQLDLSVSELAALGQQLGADVPVFVHGFSAWAQGIGEELTPIELPERWFLVVYPGVAVSTAAIYSNPQLTRDQRPITIADFLAGSASNVMTSLVFSDYPDVAQAAQQLEHYGKVSMSGSGSSLFLSFDTQQQADAAQAELAAQMPTDWTVFVSRGLNRSNLMERQAKCIASRQSD